MAENILQNLDAINYNVETSDKASSDFVAVLPEADADFRLNENHIPDDLGGYLGKNGTLVHDACDDQAGVLDGVFKGPERYILQDSPILKGGIPNEANPHFNVAQIAQDYAAVSKMAETIRPYNFMRATGLVDEEDTQRATTISGLRTTLISAGDLRWTSDAMLGRKDRHGKFVYVNFDGTYYSLKPKNWLKAGEGVTMPKKSVLKPILNVQHD